MASNPKHEAEPLQAGLEKVAFTPQYAAQGEPNAFASPGFAFEPMLAAACSFDAEIYLKVVMNMIRNPNLTTSHLFRADIFYDSINHLSHAQADEEISTRVRAMKAECRPLPISVPNYELRRTMVRQLIPRNPNLDRPITQTCHVLERKDAQSRVAYTLVVYLPHASDAEFIPWYHPAVKALAVLHTWQPSSDNSTPPGKVSIYFDFFPDSTRTTRQERTALKFLSIVHKHGEGTRLGYLKRVHHDVIIPQPRFQNTYSRLKIQYAKQLINGWVEQTPPEKHVFEDLGIAAFLIELWKDMYASPSVVNESMQEEKTATKGKQAFPGFVDIGCGNGILVYILLLEGYKGWGFDARHRKTWDTLPDWVQANLKERILVPEPFYAPAEEIKRNEETDQETVLKPTENPSILAGEEQTPKSNTVPWTDNRFVTGVFSTSPFIISNHADELTAWTPLLAYLSNSPFLSIPCCSHDLSGARFRASVSTKSHPTKPLVIKDPTSTNPNAAETGSLGKPNPKTLSAFASLCMYVERLTVEVGITPEKEILRIPSTRNTAILGRNHNPCLKEKYQVRREKVIGIVERELRMGVADVGGAWISRAKSIAQMKGEGH